MMLGLGVGGIAVGIFHLFNHAFFKALLFLGAGSVNHSTGTFDMREMGGLRKAMPWTFITFLIASISIAGIWPLAGFWSKDEILASSFTNNPILFYLAMITVFMTAFYMFRAVFLTFGGEYRGRAAISHSGHGGGKLHESPMVMVVPMVVLSVLSVVSGWLNVTGSFSQFLGHGGSGAAHGFIAGLFGILAHPLALISLLVAGLGIFLAYAMYSAKWLSAEAMGRVFKPLYTLFSRKYWFDELYERVIVVRVLVDGIFWALNVFDSRVVDGAVNGVASGTAEASGAMRRAQTGQLQLYGITIAIGVVAIAVCFYLFG
jgi:NADH-quinone oxidoreductase subunit L